jgi:predicted O-methyltransferase YrrM
MTRYDHLHRLVKQKQPKAIIEVGTWNGDRALAMLSLSPKSIYYGFDLFEDATPETDKLEFNGKRHHTLAHVLSKLASYKVHLFKGNTRETLKNFNEPVDFVWIDGGHSIETIRSDWENVKRCLAPDAWVFFDDYFTGPIDTESIGCNKIIKDLRHEILPQTDPVVGGGYTQIVRVYP